MSRERLNSEGLHSPVEEEQSLDQDALIPACAALLVSPSSSLTHRDKYYFYTPSTFIILNCISSLHRHTHSFHNIAEELDPTFRKRESQISTSPSSGSSFPEEKYIIRVAGVKRNSLFHTVCAGICLAPRTPHSIFYEYLPEPSHIPASTRQAERAGRHKAKEKRESCKQQ